MKEGPANEEVGEGDVSLGALFVHHHKAMEISSASLPIPFLVIARPTLP